LQGAHDETCTENEKLQVQGIPFPVPMPPEDLDLDRESVAPCLGHDTGADAMEAMGAITPMAKMLWGRCPKSPSREFCQFLLCDAMRCTVLVIVILSVCLSVCLSVTLVDCVHTVRPTIMISSPYGSPIILVSKDITFIPKFEGGHPERGR